MSSKLVTKDFAPSRLYSAGDCPVCADSGALLCLKTIEFGRLVFFCPSCGVAWWEPPPERTLDEVNALKNLAPDGVSLPTDEEALMSGHGLFSVEPEDWFSLLRFALAGSGVPFKRGL